MYLKSLLVAESEKDAIAGVAAFTDDATICSCENISKGAISTQIQAGCHDIKLSHLKNLVKLA